MSRSLKKGPFIAKSLRAKVLKAVETRQNKPIKTNSRASMASPEMVGLTMLVHNGKEYIPVFITEEMIGQKLGEFALTRKFPVHAGDKKAKG